MTAISGLLILLIHPHWIGLLFGIYIPEFSRLFKPVMIEQVAIISPISNLKLGSGKYFIQECPQVISLLLN
jgi:hypothetical protein